jgi:NAD(P)-dependent dehydrogenase (short-subunit alcohol dehydrogenase family)
MAGKVAVVTGAGSGVGRAAALCLLKAGFSVCLVGRRREALEETASLAPAGEALVLPTDVTDPEAVAALFQTVQTRFGRLDVLFNNAGGNVPSTNFGDLTWEQWTKVIAVNLNGMFLCANAAYRMMRDQTPRGGRIINNGSISAHTPRPGSAPYTSTKHAITGLTKSIALDGRKFDIACGQINIGNAATPMTARMANGVIQANGTMEVEPTMDVQNVGEAVAFMASLSLDANVLDMMVMATQMPFVGRG